MNIQQQVTKREWETEFSAGKWDSLDSSPLERARHAVIGMFLNSFSPEGRILDVGCGLGTTTDFLNSTQKTKYLGIDISETAVEEATKQKKMHFKAIDFLKLPVEEKFDVIIFNEVLYYLDEKASFHQALQLLRENGLIIISLYRQKRMHYSDRYIWKLSRKFFVSIEGIEVRGVVGDGRLVTWRIEVLSKKKNSEEHLNTSDRRLKNMHVYIRKIFNFFSS